MPFSPNVIARSEPELATKVVEQVASALDAAHEVGLVHRDVKPSNILISEREFVYLIDFGLARTTSEPGVTTVGSTLGTLAYMAPERFSGGQSDPRSDIYALTCVLYECLTGSRPYPSDSLEQQIAGHMVQDPPRPSESDPSLQAFDAVVAKGMAKNPERRYQTATELAAATKQAADAPRNRAAHRKTRHSARQSTRQPPTPRGSRRDTASWYARSWWVPWWRRSARSAPGNCEEPPTTSPKPGTPEIPTPPTKA